MFLPSTSSGSTKPTATSLANFSTSSRDIRATAGASQLPVPPQPIKTRRTLGVSGTISLAALRRSRLRTTGRDSIFHLQFCCQRGSLFELELSNILDAVRQDTHIAGIEMPAVAIDADARHNTGLSIQQAEYCENPETGLIFVILGAKKRFHRIVRMHIHERGDAGRIERVHRMH